MTEFRQFKVEAPSGVNFSREPSQLDARLWDGANNIAFRNGKTRKCEGFAQGFGEARTRPEIIIPFRNQNQSVNWWVYSGKNKGVTEAWKVTSQTQHDNVTPTGGFLPTTGYWGDTQINGDSLNGTPYLCDQVPYVWNNKANKFEPMNKFPKHLAFRMIKTFKNFLVGINFHVTGEDAGEGFSTWGDKAGIQQDGIWWSHNIVGTDLQTGEEEKSLWLDSDPNRNSGWNLLGGSGGPIIDAKVQGDRLIIYRETSIWAMTFTGGQNVFSFQEILSDTGPLNSNCVQDVDGVHYVIGHSDIFIHSGGQKISIADNIVATEIYKSIDRNYIQNIFSAVNYDTKEFFVCVPIDDGSASYDGSCNYAYVYNYQEKNWSKRDLPNVISATYTLLNLPQNVDSWDEIEEGGISADDPNEALDPDYPGCTWEEAVETDTWANNAFDYSDAQWGLVYGSNLYRSAYGYWEDDLFWGVDFTEWNEEREDEGWYMFTAIDAPLFSGENFSAYVEKSWQDMDDYTKTSFVNKLYPEVRFGPIEVWMSGTFKRGEAPRYIYQGMFDPELQERLDVRISGNFIHTKFVIPPTSRAELSGYTMEFAKIGRR